MADIVGFIKGNIFIEFTNKTIIIIPIKIIGFENQYNIKPIYEINLNLGEKIQNPIEIYNPHKETLFLTNLVSSFNSIELYWSNGKSIKSTQNDSKYYCWLFFSFLL